MEEKVFFGVGSNSGFRTHERLKLNPLSLPHILQKILCSLPFQDLRSSRLVCRDWEAQATCLFRRDAQVILKTIEAVETYNSDPLVRPYTFTNYQFGSGLQMNSSTCSTFFQKFGGTSRSLHFENCDWTGTSSMFRTILEERLSMLEELEVVLTNSFPVRDIIHDGNHVSSRLPRLRSLSLNFPIFDKFQYYVLGMEDFLYNFLLNAPHLKRIKYSGCSNVSHFPQTYFCKVLFELITSSSSLKLRDLRTMDLIRKYSDGQFQKLELKGFPLQSLQVRLDLHEGQGSLSQSLCSLLSSLDKTLKSLTLVFINHSDQSYPQGLNFGASLRNLEYLTLEGYKGSFDFVQDLSSLKVLTVLDY